MRALVVEDDFLLRFAMGEFLDELGFESDAARDAVEGLRRVAAAPGAYAVVLMDVHMPGMTGLDAARRIRALPDPAAARLPIVAISGDPRYCRRDAVVPFGMTDVLPKPVALGELDAMLTALLAGR